MATRHDPLPPQAVAWLVGDPARVLLLGPTGPLVDCLTRDGHYVVACDPSPQRLRNLIRGNNALARVVCAHPSRLPFDPMTFDVVLVAQSLHTFNASDCYREFARALANQGRISVVYTTRDDSVPWVRRLASIMQSVDPDAMRGNYGSDSVVSLHQTRYFPWVDQRNFRTWFPVSREQMLGMALRRPAIKRLDTALKAQVLAEIGDLYDSTARAPEPLLLPYQTSCWRAHVCQEEMSIPITFEEGLRLL